jgi:hypothetical protein
MEIRGLRGAVSFDGTTVVLTEPGGTVVDFPAACVHAAWVKPAGPVLWSLSFTVVGGPTVVTHRLLFGWRCGARLKALREQVMTVALYGSPTVVDRRRRSRPVLTDRRRITVGSSA